MIISKSSFVFIAACGWLVLSACAQKPNYSTYEDCILTHITDGKSDKAANIIAHACRSKFPRPQSEAANAQDAAAQAATAATDAARAAADAASTQNHQYP